MCGIGGFIGTRPVAADRLTAALNDLRHRGPDAEGTATGRHGDAHWALLHRRLSIIDLDPRADQPFRRDGLVLSYNGEIYNHLELRRELEGLGHSFTTSSDTEVVVEAYKRWGRDCVRHFDGMWAFALFDPAHGLWLSRDRFGEKPLYLWRRPEGLYFASEVKGLAALAGAWPRPDTAQVRRYLVNGYKHLYKRPRTWFEGVEELPAASNALLDGRGGLEVTPYWSLRYAPRADMPLTEAEEGVRERLFAGLGRRLRADVPIAFCLSGGIDSGALATIAAKHFGADVHGFSIVDSDPRYDERDTLSQTVAAIGCRHTVIETRRDGFLERMDRLVAAHDAPIVTISYYVHAFLSEAIHDAGYKVALSGTGADELFTGYYDHYSFWLAEMHGRPDYAALLADWAGGYGQVVRNPLLRDPARFAADPSLRDHIYLDRALFQGLMVDPEPEDFFEASYSDNTLRNRMLNEIAHEAVPILLREDDLNSMLFSVENRSPFLDHALAEFAFSVPNAHLIQDGRPKWLLRAAAAGYLPDAVRLDRRKRGFNASIDSMLDRNDPEVRDWLLSDGPIFDIVSRDRFASFFDGDMTANSLSKFLFSFVSARLFLDRQAEREAAI